MLILKYIFWFVFYYISFYSRNNLCRYSIIIWYLMYVHNVMLIFLLKNKKKIFIYFLKRDLKPRYSFFSLLGISGLLSF